MTDPKHAKIPIPQDADLPDPTLSIETPDVAPIEEINYDNPS